MNSFGLGLVLNFTDNATSGMKRASQTFNEMNRMASQTVDESDRAVQSLMAAGLSMSIVGSQFVDTGSAIIDMYAQVTQSVINTGMSMQGYRMQLSALYGGAEEGSRVMKEIQEYAQASVFEVQSLIPAVTLMKAVGIEALDDVTTSVGGHTQKLLDYASDLAAMMPNMRSVYGTGVQAAMGAFKEYIAEGNAMSLKRGAGLDILQILGQDKGKTIEERTQQIADLIETMNIVGYTANLAGTPMQRLSNIQDAIYNTLAQIADGGAFNAFNDLLEKASDYIFDLTKDEERMNRLTQFASDLITDLITPLGKVLDYVIRLSDTFIELIDTNPELAKTIALGGAFLGVFLVVAGTVLKLSGSIFLLTSSLTQMGLLGGQGISMMAILGTSFGFMFKKILPLIAIMALLKIAWEKNLFGIQEIVSDTVLVVKGLFDALGDNSLSLENYNRLKEEGLLPIIETVLKVKFALENFFRGFREGFTITAESVIGVVDWLVTKFDELTGGIFDVTGAIGELDYQSWEDFGQIIGGFIVLFTVFKIASIIWGIVKAIGAFGLVSKIATGAMWLLNAAMMMNPIGLLILGIVGAITALMLLRDNFDKLPEWVQRIVQPVLTFFQPIIDLVDGLINKFLELFGFSGRSIDVSVTESPTEHKIYGPKTVHKSSNSRRIKNGASTGGYTTGEGLLYLHPEELIINSDLTKRLDESLKNGGSQRNDNRVIFESGSVVLQLQNGSEAELERTAEKLMNIIARKQQLANMSKRPITV